MTKLIAYIFRKPGAFFSIEHVFSSVASEIAASGDMETEQLNLPFGGLSRISFLGNRKFLKGRNADVFHITGDVHYTALFLPANKTLLTVHDCRFMYQYGGLKKWVLKMLLLRWPVSKSGWITTISSATKQDIIRFTGCNPAKIRVIPNPVSGKITYLAKPFNQGKPDLLFIGFTPNKNLQRTIEALKGLSCRLTIVGPIPTSDQQSLESSGIDYRNYRNLSEDEMVSKYIETDIVLFPSTFEGFGLPIIEGQKAGRPVLTSNLDPMKEIAGQAAILVDPLDPASIRNGLLQIIRNSELREQLVAKGFENVKRFALKEIAAQYYSLYKEILQ